MIKKMSFFFFFFFFFFFLILTIELNQLDSNLEDVHNNNS